MALATAVTKLFLVITAIFALLGFCMFITGIVIQIRFKVYLEFIKSEFNLLAFILMLLGLCIMVAGAVGACGAAKNQENLLVGFTLIIITIICCEMIVAAAASYNKIQTESDLRDFMIELTKSYNNEESEGVRKTWDHIHQRFQCCGTNGVQDWSDKDVLPRDDTPDSCCKVVSDGCGTGLASESRSDAAYVEGCFDVIKDNIFSDVNFLIGVLIGFLAVQVLLCLLAVCVRCNIESEVSSSSS